MELVYDFKIVGGGFDGAPGMRWRDNGRCPPPPVIFVGRCERGEHCGSSACRRAAVHISYWTEDEETRPRRAQRYRKQEEFIERGEGDALSGSAVYAIGGLMDPRNFGEKAREPVVA